MQTSKWTSWIASWIHSCEVWRRRSEWRTDIPKLSAFRQHLKLRMLIRLSWRVVIRKDGTSDIAWENFIRSFRCRRMSWPRLLRKKIQRMKKKKKWRVSCYRNQGKFFQRSIVLSCFIHTKLFATLWTVACHAPLSMGFSKQEYCSGLPCPSPGDLPHPGTELSS